MRIIALFFENELVIIEIKSFVVNLAMKNFIFTNIWKNSKRLISLFYEQMGCML